MPVFYECQRCTACCRWPGQVKLTAVEVGRLAAFLGLAEADFVQRFTRLRGDRQGLALVDQPTGECVFLVGADCAIQPVKPQQCRDFPNRWRFPGFEQSCCAVAREVSETEYATIVAAAAGPPRPVQETVAT